jgi:predicted dehydrogenase
MIRIGLIGCGNISVVHVRGYSQLDSTFRVVATCDVDEARARERASAIRADAVYDDYRRVLARDDIDAVDICLPHHLHAPVALAAAQAGKHVLVEKPIATTLEEADAMIAAASAADVRLMVAHDQRWDAAHVEAKKQIADGAVGDVFCLRADHLQLVLGADAWQYGRLTAGGGALLGSGVHRVDLLRWLGGEVRRVSSFETTGVLPMTDCEDTAVTILEFEQGAVGELMTCWAVRAADPPWGESLAVYGTEGVLHATRKLTEPGSVLSLSRNGEGFESVLLQPSDRRVGLLKDFARAIDTAREPLTSGTEGRRTLEVVLAAYRAAEQRAVVELPV